ncbi:MAG: L-threonylcarbamoyladenylate synthase [Spirochaetota bacterium]
MHTVITKDPAEAASFIKRGGSVVFPTETVYGIGACAEDHSACQALYQIKGRPQDNPLIIHLAESSAIFEHAYVPKKYEDFIQHFSPGAITYILKKKNQQLFSTGLPSIGLRVPTANFTRNFLHAAALPVAAPSANLSGKPSITKSYYAKLEFSGRVDCILTGPDAEIGLESTIIDLTCEPAVILRPGGIALTDIQKFIPGASLLATPVGTTPKSPGLKYKHYAPHCKVSLVAELPEAKDKKIGRIGFHFTGSSSIDRKLQSNIQYMKELYSFFLDCDSLGIEEAFCEMPIRDKWFDSLMNRLRKAASLD